MPIGSAKLRGFRAGRQKAADPVRKERYPGPAALPELR